MDKKEELFERYPALRVCEDGLDRALSLILACYRAGGKLLLCGNGGSSADCGHIAGELMKGFLSLRPIPDKDRNAILSAFPEEKKLCDSLQRGIPALSLPSMSSVLTAYGNDVCADYSFAQLVYALARPGDLFLGISTSGNSKNVVEAAKVASALGLSSIALTGEKPCLLDGLCDCVIKVPASETFKVQEYHLPVYHCLCAEAERILFG